MRERRGRNKDMGRAIVRSKRRKLREEKNRGEERLRE